MESADVQFVKVFSIVVYFICVLIYTVNMRENAPYEAEIVVEVMDIEDPLIVERLGCLNEGPGSHRRSEGAEAYRETLHRVKTPPTSHR